MAPAPKAERKAERRGPHVSTWEWVGVAGLAILASIGAHALMRRHRLASERRSDRRFGLLSKQHAVHAAS